MTNIYEEDENKIIAAYAKHDYVISREQAEALWMEYSEVECCAVWMMMGDDLDVIFDQTFKYAEEILKGKPLS